MTPDGDGYQAVAQNRRLPQEVGKTRSPKSVLQSCKSLLSWQGIGRERAHRLRRILPSPIGWERAGVRVLCTAILPDLLAPRRAEPRITPMARILLIRVIRGIRGDTASVAAAPRCVYPCASVVNDSFSQFQLRNVGSKQKLKR